MMSTPETQKKEEAVKEGEPVKGKERGKLWEIKAIEKRIDLRLKMIEKDIRTLYIETEQLEQRIRSMELTIRSLTHDIDTLKSRLQRLRW